MVSPWGCNLRRKLCDFIWLSLEVSRLATRQDTIDVAPLDERIQLLFTMMASTIEQFPRRFNIDFVSIDAETAVMLVNGMRRGS